MYRLFGFTLLTAAIALADLTAITDSLDRYHTVFVLLGAGCWIIAERRLAADKAKAGE